MMTVDDWIQKAKDFGALQYIDPIRADDTTTSSPSMERTVESVTGEIVGHLKAGRVGRQGKADIRDALDKSDRDGALGRAIIGRVLP